MPVSVETTSPPGYIQTEQGHLQLQQSFQHGDPPTQQGDPLMQQSYYLPPQGGHPQTQQLEAPQVKQAVPDSIRVAQEYQSGLLAKCARGDHDGKRTYGACGIIAAICLFPLGLICLGIDSETRCVRCNAPV